ncbi:MAG: hypothetical protein V7641_2889 [Blastocatellia bacterium]
MGGCRPQTVRAAHRAFTCLLGDVVEVVRGRPFPQGGHQGQQVIPPRADVIERVRVGGEVGIGADVVLKEVEYRVRRIGHCHRGVDIVGGGGLSLGVRRIRPQRPLPHREKQIGKICREVVVDSRVGVSHNGLH